MPDRKVIHWLADPDNPIPEALRPAIEQQGFEWCAFTPGHAVPAVLFVFSPVWNGYQYLSIEGIWAKYLAKDYPATKLIIVGNQESMDANFVDVLQWPKDLAAFIEQVPEAARFKSEMPAFTGGVDMTERMKRFLKGHGNESMAAVCIDMWNTFQQNVDALKRNKGFAAEIAQELRSEQTLKNWQTLYSRWINYQFFFGFLPFYRIFETVNVLMEQLQPFFEEPNIHEDGLEQHLQVTCLHLQKLQHLLEQLDEYVK